MSEEKALPEGWMVVPLARIADIQGGIQKQPKRAPVKNAYPFLRVANVLRGRLDLSEIHRVELFEGELERLRLLPGDLLIVEGNGSRSEIGRVAVWNGAIHDCIHQNHIIRARLLPDILPKFAEAYWNSPEGIEQIVAVASSTSGLYTLSVSKVGCVQLPIVPLHEQTRIVDEVEKHFSRIDAGIAALKRVQANLKSQRASILKAACEGRLVPTEVELARAEGRTYEPADRLLARILQERRARWEADQLAKMKAKGQAPKDDRWRDMYEEPKGLDASDLVELPKGWVSTCLGQLTNLVTSGSRGWGDRYADARLRTDWRRRCARASCAWRVWGRRTGRSPGARITLCAPSGIPAEVAFAKLCIVQCKRASR